MGIFTPNDVSLLSSLKGLGRYIVNATDLDAYAKSINNGGKYRVNEDEYTQKMNSLNSSDVDLDTYFNKQAELNEEYPEITTNELSVGNAIPLALGIGIAPYRLKRSANALEALSRLGHDFVSTAPKAALINQSKRVVFDPAEIAVNSSINGLERLSSLGSETARNRLALYDAID